jgi:plastocyanin
MRPTVKRSSCAGAVALLLGIGLSGLPLGAAGEKPAPTHHVVTIDATSYRPRTLTLKAGDSVEWVNADIYVHTVTARDGGFDSRDIPAGGTWKHTPGGSGLLAYRCIYHPSMKGTLRIR